MNDGLRVGGIVLAAGAATRFGSPKQLAVLRGRPLLEYACMTMEAVPAIEPRVVVLGAHAQEIRDRVDLHGAKPVICARWAEGLAASLATGVDALGDVDAAVIVLGDQPHITPQVLAMVVDAADGHELAARATYHGLPGHPVLIRRALFADLSRLRGDRGARDLLDAAGVKQIEAAHLCSAFDVDTPADLEGLSRGDAT